MSDWKVGASDHEAVATSDCGATSLKEGERADVVAVKEELKPDSALVTFGIARTDAVLNSSAAEEQIVVSLELLLTSTVSGDRLLLACSTQKKKEESTTSLQPYNRTTGYFLSSSAFHAFRDIISYGRDFAIT